MLGIIECPIKFCVRIGWGIFIQKGFTAKCKLSTGEGLLAVKTVLEYVVFHSIFK